MKLIDKVKPEVLEVLTNKTKIDYSASYRSIITSLKNKDFYRDLTINEIDSIIMDIGSEFILEGVDGIGTVLKKRSGNFLVSWIFNYKKKDDFCASILLFTPNEKLFILKSQKKLLKKYYIFFIS